MLDDIYNQRILTLAAHVPRLGRLASPMATAVAHSKLCGSKITVDIIMDNGVVTDFAHEVKACALGQASSAIMANNIIGSTAAELRAVQIAVRRMLKESGAPPTGKWQDAVVLQPVSAFKARHASTLLTFDAVVDAIGQIEAQEEANLRASQAVA